MTEARRDLGRASAWLALLLVGAGWPVRVAAQAVDRDPQFVPLEEAGRDPDAIVTPEEPESAEEAEREEAAEGPAERPEVDSEPAATPRGPLEEGAAEAEEPVVRASRARTVRRTRARARHDVVLRWAPRYRLDTTTDPLGLEQQLWRRVDSLPLYHRAALDVTDLADGHVSLHFAGWGALDLLADSEGGVAAGDVAIGYVEVELAPFDLWAGRRFVTYGPPGGLHVDGGGASTRTDFGMIVEAFVGRPVTPARVVLLGPEPGFEDESAVAYGARVAYADAGTFGASAGYAERRGHGIVGSQTVDLAGYWYPGPLRVEAGTKVDVRDPGVAQARIGAALRVAPQVTVDADYLHLEPGRWIPPWSILSVFETTTFDEVSVGGTWRPMRPLTLRAELAGRMYSRPSGQTEPNLGYRAEVMARVLPLPDPGVRLRVLASRRDDGVVGYTVVMAGVAFDPWPAWVVAFDGAFAIDDAAQRDSLLARATVELTPEEAWKIGVTLSLARTPIVEAEARAMLRASWSPEVPQ